MDGTGRMGLLTEADVIELQQVLRPRSEDSGIAELYGYWMISTRSSMWCVRSVSRSITCMCTI